MNKVISNFVGRMYLADSIALGNASVGQITVRYLLATMAIIALEGCAGAASFASKVNKAAEAFGVAFFVKGAIKAEDYVSQLISGVDPETGLEVIHVTSEMIQHTWKQVSTGKILWTPANLLALSRDLVAYARYHQEKTIDAAKNFYNVKVPYMDNLGRVSLLHRKRDLEEFCMSILWTEEDLNKWKRFASRVAELPCQIASLVKRGEEVLEGNVKSRVALKFKRGTGWRTVLTEAGEKRKFFLDDIFNEMSVKGLQAAGETLDKLAQLYPAKLSEVLNGVEKWASESSPEFRVDFRAVCDICNFYKSNVYRSLATAQSEALARARKNACDWDKSELKAEERAIKAHYSEAFARVGAQCWNACQRILGATFKGAALEKVYFAALLWAASRGEDGKRLELNKISSFAEIIAPRASFLYYMGLAKRYGYKAPSGVNVEVTLDGDAEAALRRIIPNGAEEFDFGTVELRSSTFFLTEEVAAFADAEDGDYSFVWSKEDGFNLVMPFEALIPVPEKEEGTLQLVTSNACDIPVEEIIKAYKAGSRLGLVSYHTQDRKPIRHSIVNVDTNTVVGQYRIPQMGWGFKWNKDASRKRSYDPVEAIEGQWGGLSGEIDYFIVNKDQSNKPYLVVGLKNVEAGFKLSGRVNLPTKEASAKKPQQPAAKKPLNKGFSFAELARQQHS